MISTKPIDKRQGIGFHNRLTASKHIVSMSQHEKQTSTEAKS